MPVPNSLRIWFVIHFALDVIFAIQLFFFPVEFLSFFNWPAIDPLASRLVAAALFGIGIESYLGRNASAEAFKNLLNLKIIWSAFATLGILISILESPNSSAQLVAWLLFLTFLLFNILWVYWRIRVGKL